MEDERTDQVRIVALVCLTVIVVAAIAGLTVVAVTTDRDMWKAEVLTFLAATFVAMLGGLVVLGSYRRHRWRLEREDVNGAPSSPGDRGGGVGYRR